VPEGDTLHRAAAALAVLLGERLEVEAAHPRARATGVAERLDGRSLEAVEAVGKNLVLRFAGGAVLRSHLRMSGSWRVVPRGAPCARIPWLRLRGAEYEALLFGGPVLELNTRALDRLGPDILSPEPDLGEMLARMARADPSRPLGETLLDQSLVAGIGNLWMAESLWQARLSPWLALAEVSEDERRRALESAAVLMRSALGRGRDRRRQVYRRTGRPCRRCGETIRSAGQGDANRRAYWCPRCQPGLLPSAAGRGDRLDRRGPGSASGGLAG
jgi:endonuclease VIII